VTIDHHAAPGPDTDTGCPFGAHGESGSAGATTSPVGDLTGFADPYRDLDPAPMLTYGSYLRLDELLRQQVSPTGELSRDELLFITIHQTYELWFQLILAEMSDARDRMLEGETRLPRVRLARCDAIERVLVSQVDLLDTLSPQGFLAFRDNLAPASGFQSVQFREIEFLSGLKDPGYVDRFRGLAEPEKARLRRRCAEPSLWDGYLAVMRRHGLAVGTREQRADSLARVARDPERFGELWDLAESLIQHDQNWVLWRTRHLLMAEREIGRKGGTGGSSGGNYLQSRTTLRFYPELWEMRSRL
jgi:tryptophan 2,3-dioxygenase